MKNKQANANADKVKTVTMIQRTGKHFLSGNVGLDTTLVKLMSLL
jgi:hypothetical protein